MNLKGPFQERFCLGVATLSKAHFCEAPQREPDLLHMAGNEWCRDRVSQEKSSGVRKRGVRPHPNNLRVGSLRGTGRFWQVI